MNRMGTYPMRKEAKGNELNTIQDILHNNKYNKTLSTRHSNEHKPNKNTDRQHQKTEWIIFTYSGKETKKVTKLFKETQIGTALRTRNTIQNVVKPLPLTDKYGRNGVYEMNV
jgi:hypothetical protein